MRPRIVISLLIAVLAGVLAPPVLRAQESSSKRPPEPEPPAEEKRFEPLQAEKDIDVGNFYFKKGNYDAAIERYQDALLRKPNFAIPYRLLGEAYEKKGEKAEAVKSYEKYLEILPRAEDAAKVRKRIEKLKQEIEKDSARHHSVK